MLPGFRSIQRSLLWRAIYIVCMLMVFSYIFFVVLDLDGSDFPLPSTPMEKPVIVAEVPSDLQCPYFPGWAKLRGNFSVLFPDGLGEYALLQQTEVLTSSPLDSARAHGYRVGLPRDSITDLPTVA